MNARYGITTCRDTNCRTTPEPGYADRGLCQPHETDAIAAIDAIPEDYTDVRALVWDKPTAGGAPTGVFGPSEPVNLAADALAGEIAYAAVQWGEIVAERAGLPEPPNLWAAARILGENFTALISTPEIGVEGYNRALGYLDGLDAAIWFIDLHRRAVAHVGVSARTRRLPGVCPKCNSPTLDHNVGADIVRCARCRESWTWLEYDLHRQLTMWGTVA